MTNEKISLYLPRTQSLFKIQEDAFMIPDLSIGKLLELLAEKAERCGVPPPLSYTNLLIIENLALVLWNENKICALSSTYKL